MRLFHFCHTYISQTETFLFRSVEKSRESADVWVFTFHLSNLNQFSPDGNRGLQIVNLHPFRQLPRSVAEALHDARQLASGISWRRRLESSLKSKKPDLIHCHFGQMGVRFMEFLQGRNLTVKYVVSFYGADASVAPVKDSQYARALPELWSSASGFLVEGPALGRKLAALGAPPEKIHVWPLIIPVKEYRTKPQLADLKQGIRFLLIGRFVEKKGFNNFFQSLGQVKTRLPPFSVTVIGDGDLKPDYLKTIRNYGYEDRVHFLGFRPHTECLALMLDHDVLVQASITAANGDSEGGAPTILIEAQAIGIPIISSDHADIPFVMGYSDLQMPENKPAILAEILANLPNRTDLQDLVLRGRRKVELQHDAATAHSPYLRFI